MKSPGAEWILAVSPAVQNDALLIGDGYLPSAAILQHLFRNVDVWFASKVAFECDDRGYIYQEQKFFKRQIDLNHLDDEFSIAGKQWALIAFLDSIESPNISVRKTIELAHAYLAPGGQCCVVTGDRSGIARVKREKLRAFRYPSAKKIATTMAQAGFGSQKILRPYPDHIRATELVGWDKQKSKFHQCRIVNLMLSIGLGRLAFESAVILGSKGPERPILQGFIDADAEASSLDWIEQILIRGDGTIVCIYRRKGISTGYVLKIPLSEPATRRLETAWHSAVSAKAAQPWLEGVIPNQVCQGRLYDISYYTEEQCEGITALEFASDRNKGAIVTGNAVDFLIRLASRTATLSATDQVTRMILDTYLGPIGKYRSRYKSHIDTLSKWVAGEIRSENFPLVLVHGDFNPCNVFCRVGDGEICGIIDWDATELPGPPLLDLYSFLFGMNPGLRESSMGRKIELWLDGRAWSVEDADHIAKYVASLQINSDRQFAFLVLYWAKHVCTHLKYSMDGLRVQWEEENLLRPLERILESTS